MSMHSASFPQYDNQFATGNGGFLFRFSKIFDHLPCHFTAKMLMENSSHKKEVSANFTLS